MTLASDLYLSVAIPDPALRVKVKNMIMVVSIYGGLFRYSP